MPLSNVMEPSSQTADRSAAVGQGPSSAERVEVAIIGAGMSGICMARQLLAAGIESVLILEKSPAAGGTWHDNTYPGACCDVASHLYSYSFRLNPDWSRIYSPQTEINAYFADCIEDFGLRSHIRYSTPVDSAHYDEQSQHWLLQNASGLSIRARFLVSGVGQLSQPAIPDFPGLDRFAGPAFHSARWDHSVDLAGKRVAVIGNAASAIQFIPHLAAQASEVLVFQRSANYVLPRGNRCYSALERRLFKRSPTLMRLYRYTHFWINESIFPLFVAGNLFRRFSTWVARRKIVSQVADPQLAQRLLPDYPLGCKRILISDDYYQTLVQEHVHLITRPVQRFDARGITVAAGSGEVEDIGEEHHDVDLVVFGTGFQTQNFLYPIEVVGRQALSLHQVWQQGAEAYRGVCVAGFPNLFILYGPNTNLGHNSIIFMVEQQVNYIVRALRYLRKSNAGVIEVREERAADYNQRLQKALRRTVWYGSCNSWYRNEAGRIVNNWPHSTPGYWLHMRGFRPQDFSLQPRRESV